MKALNFAEEYAGLVLRDGNIDVVYGPVQSRRFGFTLGVNLLSPEQKACSFDCSYCDLGRTNVRLNKLKSSVQFPASETLGEGIRLGFDAARSHTKKIDSILISGNGEPTLSPYFPEVIDMIIKARNEFLPDAKIIVLTNGAHLDSRKVVDALNKVDERVVKVDVGNDRLLKLMNSPLSRTSVSSIISNMRNLKDVIVQTMFVKGSLDNTEPADLDDWIEVVGLLKPKAVHITTISRVPGASGLQAVDEDGLYTLASRLERRTHLRSLVFP
jgi:wyosine [tRNA(Phe)-imidazoG37] synthetase (radical SAM superfamily)